MNAAAAPGRPPPGPLPVVPVVLAWYLYGGGAGGVEALLLAGIEISRVVTGDKSGGERTGKPPQRAAGIDKVRRVWYDENRRCCIMAVGHFPEKGGDADGKRSLGPCPAFRGMLTHRPCGDAVHSPKCVLTARLVPKRST